MDDLSEYLGLQEFKSTLKDDIFRNHPLFTSSLWENTFTKEEPSEPEEDKEEDYVGVFASVALECLLTEDDEPKEIIKKKRGRKKKSELLQMKAKEKPIRRRLNMVEPGGPFYCESPGCGKFYCRRRELNRHQRYSCLTPPQFQCEFCPLRTSQKYNLLTHMRIKHADQFYVGHDLL